ncbi:MAG: TonB C-terminal domain-containing protein [Sterolibacterium sp.]
MKRLLLRRLFCTTAGSALLLVALTCGAAEGDIEKGIAAYRRGDYTAAFAEFKIAASQDDPFSQNVLGTLYADGHGVDVNYKLALDWFSKAQALGSVEATVNLARMYESGLGVPRNQAAALQYYRDAARAGFQPAIVRMAEIHARGELGVTPDRQVVLDWHQRLSGPAARFGPAVTLRPAAPPVPAVGSGVLVPVVGSGVRVPVNMKKAALASLDKDAIFEKQLWQRLDRYQHSERKWFVAATESTPVLAAYLKDLRAQLKGRSAAAFIAAKREESMLVTLAILRDGALRDVELSQGSGNSGRDHRVLASLRQLKRFDPWPAQADGSADVLMVTARLPID